jgi:erythromycin esterase-like protein
VRAQVAIAALTLSMAACASTEPVRVAPVPEPAPTLTRVVEPAEAVLVGTVRGPDGAPIAGATVALRSSESMTAEHVTRTAADGSYQLPRPAGAWDHSVTHRDFSGAFRRLVDAAAEPRIDVALEPGGFPFSVQLLGHGLTRLEPISFSTREFGKQVFGALPDASGRVEVRLPEDGYLVMADTPGRDGPQLFAHAGHELSLRIEALATMAEPPDAKAMAELRAGARSLDELGALLASQLDPARPTIIGLGESVHGAKEPIGIRLPLTLRLAARSDVVVALEANWSHVLAAEAYIQGGAGDPVAIARDLRFFMWRNRELAAALDVLRAHNRSHRHKIHLAGIDMQAPDDNLAALATCRVSAAARAAMPWPAGATPTMAQLDDAARALVKLAPAPRPIRWPVTRCSPLYVRAALHALSQNLGRLQRDWFSGIHNRDRGMAANILELAIHGKAPVVVWAHNGHIRRGGDHGYIPLGAHLARDPRVRYIPVGMVSGPGRFNARLPERNHEIAVAELPPPEAHHLARHLDGLRAGVFAIDLRTLPDASRSRLSRLFRIFEPGGVFFGAENSALIVIPTVDYDALVYAPTLSAATLIPEAP